MCSVSAALIGLTAAQGITSMASAHQQAKAQSAYYNAQADAAEQNARIADKQREQISDQYLQKPIGHWPARGRSRSKRPCKLRVRAGHGRISYRRMEKFFHESFRQSEK